MMRLWLRTTAWWHDSSWARAPQMRLGLRKAPPVATVAPFAPLRAERMGPGLGIRDRAVVCLALV